jgi:hypothetical protein
MVSIRVSIGLCGGRLALRCMLVVSPPLLPSQLGDAIVFSLTIAYRHRTMASRRVDFALLWYTFDITNT